MQCDRCQENIKNNEERDFHGQTLCEDCYMVALSPAKACDPWAVHSAKSFSEKSKRKIDLTQTQAKILKFLKESKGAEPEVISDRIQISLPDLEREIATLRHMEKVRAKLQEGKKIICLW
ncbi:hypothetical protein [Desulfospira joergensenii]|uniref:hypothetical protein n=1 Tax=Desulfospira joergensenii TaxID=53329 RepID=UPI0003B3073C|nr:hypothetical protein [Desulfospira joergensenii]